MQPPLAIIAVTRPEPHVPLALVFVALMVHGPKGARVIESSDDAYMEKQIVSHFGSSWLRWRRITSADIPADTSWRNAWVDTGSALVVDLDRARTLHAAQLAASASRAHTQLTAALLLAMTEPDAQRMQALRAARDLLTNAPSDPRLAAARTLDALAAIDPVRQALASVGLK